METRSRVIDRRGLTPTTHLVRIERPEAFSFEAGQHVVMEIMTRAGEEERFLSIASGPVDDHIELAVRLSDSDFKRGFQDLEPGDRVRLMGPSGRFRRDAERAAIFLSGGIGITPLRSMLRDAAERGNLPPTVLVYGNRSPREIPFREELDAMAAAGRGIRVLHTVSHPDGTWPGATGFIDQALIENALTGLVDPGFYVCGPPRMVIAMVDLLGSMGISKEEVRVEHFTGYED